MHPRLKSVIGRVGLVALAVYLGCIAGRVAYAGRDYFSQFELRELHPFAAVVSVALAAASIPAMFFLVVAVIVSALFLSPRFPLWTWCAPFVAYALVSYAVLTEFKGF